MITHDVVFSVALAGAVYDNLFSTDRVCRTTAGRSPSSPTPTQPHPTTACGVCSLLVSLSSPVCMFVVCVCVRSMHRTPQSRFQWCLLRVLCLLFTHVSSRLLLVVVLAFPPSLSRLWLTSFSIGPSPTPSSFLPLPLSADCIRRQPKCACDASHGQLFVSLDDGVPSFPHAHTHICTHPYPPSHAVLVLKTCACFMSGFVSLVFSSVHPLGAVLVLFLFGLVR